VAGLTTGLSVSRSSVPRCCKFIIFEGTRSDAPNMVMSFGYTGIIKAKGNMTRMNFVPHYDTDYGL